MVHPLSYFSFQPVIHDWCNKGRGMCHPVCGMMHIKEPLLLIGKSSPCGGSGFPLSLSEWSFIICLTPYNRKYNVLSASLNKTFPSFLPSVQLGWAIPNSCRRVLITETRPVIISYTFTSLLKTLSQESFLAGNRRGSILEGRLYH